MIQIHVNAARIERVLFVAGSDLEEDFDHAAWQVIRRLVDRMDRRLREAATDAAWRFTDQRNVWDSDEAAR